MPSERRPGPLRVLVVDDYPDGAASLALLLRCWGHQAWAATSGAEALRLAEENLPDVVVLELRLPDVSGYELAQRLRSSACGDGLLVLAVTSQTRPSHCEWARQAGCDAYLLKPMAPEMLWKLLERYSRGAINEA